MQRNLKNLAENWLELGLNKRYSVIVVVVIVLAVAISVASNYAMLHESIYFVEIITII